MLTWEGTSEESWIEEMSELLKGLIDLLIQQHRDAIEMFIEYRDVHGYDEETAKYKAIDEARQGFDISNPDILENLPAGLKAVQAKATLQALEGVKGK